MTARIALDAMGGDHAPHQTVLGAVDAAAAGVDVVLVGDPALLEPHLEEAGANLPVISATEVVSMDDDPASAIREKKGASVTVAARMVADGEAAGMVSAGSTGATLAASAIVVGRLPGVSRPAIAAVFPLGNRTVVLDVGANLEVKPSNLAEFGVMGASLAQTHLAKPSPRVGLLNIGEEPGKGREIEKEAHAELGAMPIDFTGNVEGRDLGAGTVDVIVTDGFTGNVLLKTAEGTARAAAALVMKTLADDTDPRFREAAGTVLPRLLAVRDRMDPEAYGGAHLLGVKGTVVIAHGSSSRVAVANALRVAAEGADAGLPAKIEAGLRG